MIPDLPQHPFVIREQSYSRTTFADWGILRYAANDFCANFSLFAIVFTKFAIFLVHVFDGFAFAFCNEMKGFGCKSSSFEF